jgi:P-type Ca2+ transporter type 2C
MASIPATFSAATVQGLSEGEARRRLKEEGPNELPQREGRGFIRTALEVVREPMILLLLAAGALYVALGDHAEAVLLVASIGFIIGIELYQERRTERTLEALRDLSSPRALVIRDGEQRRIAGHDVVRDDIVVLGEGDRVPADAILLSATNLSTDESLLTGESVPVRKVAREAGPDEQRPGGDGLPYVYSGSLVTAGQGFARVVTVGAHTEMGRIGRALQSLGAERTRLQRDTDRLVRVLAVAGLGLCLLVVVLYALLRGSLLDGILAGLTLAMALVPEEFPVVLTVFLALGAWRIAQQHVLTRRSPAVEALGTATVLCVDKTGTLTQNRMTVRRLSVAGRAFEVNDDTQPVHDWLRPLVEYGMLATPDHPFDPMEQAIRAAGSRLLTHVHGHDPEVLVRAYPLSDMLLAVVHVWQATSNAQYMVAAKGAPEAIAELCHLTSEGRERLLVEVAAMASEGLRVLAVARADTQGPTLPDDQRAFSFELLGLIGLADPIRLSVRAAIAECYRAGVRVVMLTGDYPLTAQSIARQIGLRPLDPVLTGPELEAMDEATLQVHARHAAIFARVRPEQKLRLVRALQANGDVVAMTGDGVNDAPALKAANIGIAMGGRGTDVAREAAALVLLDDDFTSIVHAVRLGRRIFDNLRKSMGFLLAVHVPIAGLALLPLLLGWPLILLPVHVVFLELIIDPACSLVFEAEREEPNVMRRPPRPADEPLFGRWLVQFSLVRGAIVLIATLGVLALALAAGQTEPEARALAFATLVLADLGLILSGRSGSRSVLHTLRSRNLALTAVTGGAVLLLALVLAVPALRGLFKFAALHADDLGLAVGVALLTLLLSEGLKLFGRRTTADAT